MRDLRVAPGYLAYLQVADLWLLGRALCLDKRGNMLNAWRDGRVLSWT